jgi:hypothetical protein
MVRGIDRTPSVAYREGTREAIEKVLEKVDEQALKRVRDGFSELNFTIGVLNCFFILAMFNVYPQHLWIVYIVEALFLIPAKFHTLIEAKPLCNIFYYFDLCWFMNISGAILLVLLFLGKGQIPEEFRKELFLGTYGMACGPLLGATAALPFVSLVFHNVETMTGLFIHFYPPLLFYTFRWKAGEILEAWPNAFALDYEIVFWPQGSFTGCVFGNTIIAYFVWFVPYLIWQLYYGLDLPRSERKTKLADGSPAPAVYDTVFHSTMRNGLCVAGGKLLWKRPEEVSMEQVKTNNFEMRDFIVYMGVHMVAVLLSTVCLAYPCYLSKYAHAAFLWMLAILCTYRGSLRYTYYSTKMYSKIIRKQFADKLDNRSESSSLDESSSLKAVKVKIKTNEYHFIKDEAIV